MMKTRRLSLTIALIALNGLLFYGCEKSNYVSGIVYDENHNPLKGITLSVDSINGKEQVTTNDLGQFKLKNVESGDHIFYLQGKEGIGNIKVTVSDESTSDLSFTYPVVTQVTIYHLNDVHASIDNLPKIAAFIKKEKKEKKNIFFLNAGDNFSGNPFVDQHPQKGRPMVELWNEIGLDVMTLGNHEFDYGQDTLNQRMIEAKYKIVSANIVNKDAILNPVEPMTELTTENQLKIGVIGLIDTSGTGGTPKSHPRNLVGLKFLDPVEAIKQYESSLGSYNAKILLSHLGIEVDEIVANSTRGLDLIIGGHSHTQIDKPYLVNNVMIAQAKDKAKMLGKIDLTFKNQALVEKKGELLKVKDMIEVDPVTKGMVDNYNNNPALNVEIATLETAISGKDELGSFVNDATRKILDLDIVFCNNGGLRIEKLNAGGLKLKDVYALLPFSNEIISINMSTEEIRELIKSSIEKNKDGEGIDLQVSGLSYIVKAKSYREVTSVELYQENGAPLDENRTYKVGMNSYISSAYQFKHNDPGTSTYVADNEAVINYLKQLNGAIVPSYKDVKRMEFLLLK